MAQREKVKTELLALVDDGNELLAKFQDAKKHPSVHESYQSWYSKSLRAMEWLARDRYEEFRRYYEPDPKRKSLGYGTYVVQDFLRGVKPGGYNHQDFDSRGRATICLFNQLTLLGAVVERADSLLDDLQGALFSELQDEEIDTAESLMKASPRAAGALAGVILESHLQKVAASHGVKIPKKSPTIADLNDPLKASGVYETAVWRKISYLADVRNLCSHKKTVEPTQEQCRELIDGVRWAVKNIA